MAVAVLLRAMPKSMRRGPSTESMTFPGLRSRCSTPARCRSARARAIPAPSARTAGTGSAPPRRTACARLGPGTYSVASQGVPASASPPTGAAAYGLSTSEATLISRRNRSRKAGSPATSRRTVLTATKTPGTGATGPPREAPSREAPSPAPLHRRPHRRRSRPHPHPGRRPETPHPHPAPCPAAPSPREEHLAHPARSEPCEDLVRSDPARRVRAQWFQHLVAPCDVIVGAASSYGGARTTEAGPRGIRPSVEERGLSRCTASR